MEFACESDWHSPSAVSRAPRHEAAAKAEQDHQRVEVIFKPPFQSCDHFSGFLCFGQCPTWTIAMRNGPAETNRLLTSRKSRRTARLKICWTLQRSSQASPRISRL